MLPLPGHLISCSATICKLYFVISSIIIFNAPGLRRVLMFQVPIRKFLMVFLFPFPFLLSLISVRGLFRSFLTMRCFYSDGVMAHRQTFINEGPNIVVMVLQWRDLNVHLLTWDGSGPFRLHHHRLTEVRGVITPVTQKRVPHAGLIYI